MELSTENMMMLEKIQNMLEKHLDKDNVKANITLYEYITDTYLPYYVQKTSKDLSIKSDLYRVGIILQHKLAKMDIGEITQPDIELFLSYLIKDRKISKATVNRYRARLLTIFNHALKLHIIKENVVKYCTIYREQNRTVVLSDDEIKSLLCAAKLSKNKHLYFILVINFNTGMRKGEILSLRKNDIVGRDIILRACVTKSGYKRIVPMNEELCILMHKHIATLEDDDKLFNLKDIRRSLSNAIKKAGISEFRFHDGRRTCATQLKNRDVTIYNIKEILGHCNTNMTEHYLANNLNQLHQAVNKIGYK